MKKSPGKPVHRFSGPPRPASGRQKRDADGLIRREARFAAEYLRDFNATQAARRAGYPTNSAHVSGCNLLKKPNVAMVIERSKAERMQRLKMDGDEVLLRAAAIARGNLQSIVTWDRNGVVQPRVASDQLTELEAYGIAEVAEIPGKNGNTFKIKMRDPQAALQILGRYANLPGFAPPGVAIHMPKGPAGVLLDGEGGVTIYLPDNQRATSAPVPALDVGHDNGGPPA